MITFGFTANALAIATILRELPDNSFGCKNQNFGFGQEIFTWALGCLKIPKSGKMLAPNEKSGVTSPVGQF